MKSHPLLLIILLFIPVTSCRNKPAADDSFKPVFSTYNTSPSIRKNITEKKEICYGLLTPVEICVIFNRLGISYNKEILNPCSNNDYYLSLSKASVNTGIYGVDLGYLKMFGLGQEMIDYMVTIRSLSNKLGIPDNYLTDPIRSIESDISDPDTVMKLMNDAYYKIEDHLRDGGRESTAGLMVMGGWVEAMYIATQLVYNEDNPDPEVIEKIAEQKYTLTTLLSFMKNYYDDPVVVYYTKKLKFLKNYFDTFDIYFKKGDLEIDTSRQLIRSSGSEMTVTIETLNKIRDYVKKLRTELVTP
jgi:hypothetical protein